MSKAEIDNYSYLWDGSAPEWHLRPLPKQIEAVIFFENGVTGKDVLKLKNISSEYAKVPTAELLLKLKGMTSVSLNVISMDVAVSLEKKCKESGVELRLIEKEARYVIVNGVKNCILAIEDNDIYREVKERMLMAGRRVSR
ncbi:hypothetical protein ACN9MU_16755 [Pseudoduganella sp. R-32]|uniref:hypothetical protein n=1 Tax=Pseudoduganella sp. R-32 TaxID=3404061 RepID=UPI003CF7EF2F